MKGTKIVKQFFKAILWFISGLFNLVKRAWQNYQRNRRLRQMEEAKLRKIAREAEAVEFGKARGMRRGSHLGDYEGRELVRKRKQKPPDPFTLLFGERKRKKKG